VATAELVLHQCWPGWPAPAEPATGRIFCLTGYQAQLVADYVYVQPPVMG